MILFYEVHLKFRFWISSTNPYCAVRYNNGNQFFKIHDHAHLSRLQRKVILSDCSRQCYRYLFWKSWFDFSLEEILVRYHWKSLEIGILLWKSYNWELSSSHKTNLPLSFILNFIQQGWTIFIKFSFKPFPRISRVIHQNIGIQNNKVFFFTSRLLYVHY